MLKFLIIGRSIDGSVYAHDTGWTSDRKEATRYTYAEAERRMRGQIETNRKREPDCQVGQLRIVPEKSRGGQAKSFYHVR